MNAASERALTILLQAILSHMHKMPSKFCKTTFCGVHFLMCFVFDISPSHFASLFLRTKATTSVFLSLCIENFYGVSTIRNYATQ